MKSVARSALILSVFLVPLFSFAATTIVGGSSGNSGYIGVQGGNSGFAFSWGNGANGVLCNSSICGVASTIIYIINSVLVPLLFAIAFIMFLYGIARAYIFSHGDSEEVKKGHTLVLWGIIGFVVMISLWGLVNVVATTFGLTGIGAPPPPTSY
ncbi:hypothetical protein KGM48_03820 [Patescibacteria group bacterium]|nr:hypothetical protein [Patescibacteria group bacterium]